MAVDYDDMRPALEHNAQDELAAAQEKLDRDRTEFTTTSDP